MNSRDSGLELVLANRPLAHCAVDEGKPFGDERLIPECSILVRERDQLPRGVGSRGASGIDEQHESEQTGDLAVVAESGTSSLIAGLAQGTFPDAAGVLSASLSV